MDTQSIARLLAEPERLRAFSAVVLGAEDIPEVAAAAGLTVPRAATAIGRLREGGLVEGPENALSVRTDRFKEAVRRETAHRTPTEDPLDRFVRDGRLVELPRKFTKRALVLRRLAAESFRPGDTYGEKAVDEVLRGWCATAEVDHVTVRRYLIDHCVMSRDAGRYRLRQDVPA